MGWVGELGTEKDPNTYGKARKALAALASPADEPTLKPGRTRPIHGRRVKIDAVTPITQLLSH